jgi:hypothetical protein
MIEVLPLSCPPPKEEIWHRLAHPEHSSPDGLAVTDAAEVLKRLQICDAPLSKQRQSLGATRSCAKLLPSACKDRWQEF